jgi:hypothetical protein
MHATTAKPAAVDALSEALRAERQASWSPLLLVQECQQRVDAADCAAASDLFQK